MAMFRKYNGINIKYTYQDDQNALRYPELRLLMYFT